MDFCTQGSVFSFFKYYFSELYLKKIPVQAAKPVNVDAYIASFPKDIQSILDQVRNTIKIAAPDAEECISYAMPTYKQNGVLVHFAAFKNHIGFYATPTGHEAFQEALSKYKTGHGSVQFPLDEPMPLDLIREIVLFRVEEQSAKAKATKSKATPSKSKK